MKNQTIQFCFNIGLESDIHEKWSTFIYLFFYFMCLGVQIKCLFELFMREKMGSCLKSIGMEVMFCRMLMTSTVVKIGAILGL